MFFNRGAAGKKLDYFLSFFQVLKSKPEWDEHLLNHRQYYVHTKTSLPLDIDFTVQDTFALTRPQWKLAANLEEAAKAFQLAITQDQKSAGVDKTADMDDASSDTSSDDDNGDVDGDDVDGDGDDESASEEEEVDVSCSCGLSFLRPNGALLGC